jgi:hypothetical protein
MFGKVVRKTKEKKLSNVQTGLLFEVVESVIPEHKGLICVRTFDGIVCIVGNDSFKSFHSTWDINPTPSWTIRVLDEEQVILSNQEIK